MSFLDGIQSMDQPKLSPVFLFQHELHPLCMLLDDPLGLDFFFVFSSLAALRIGTRRLVHSIAICTQNTKTPSELVMQGRDSSQSEETQGNTRINAHKQCLKLN